MLEWSHGKYCNNVVFRRKFNIELLSLNYVAFLKRICSNWQYMTMKSSKIMLNQIWPAPIWLPLWFLLSTWYSRHVFILDYLLSYLEPRLYWENWKIDYLVWTISPFQKKTENRYFWFEACCLFYDINSKWQHVSIRSQKIFYVVPW